MDDRFLHEQNREPRPGFVRSLRERLREVESDREVNVRFRLHPAFASAAAVGAIALAFTVPAVRAVAQSALDMFRVRSFAAIEVDESRMDQLKKLHEQFGKESPDVMFGEKVMLQDPGKPVEYASAAAAAAAAGWSDLRTPSDLPDGIHFDKASVQGEGAARFTVRTQKLQQIVDALGLSDVHVPQGFDGQDISVRMPVSISQQYTNGKRTLSLFQGSSPQVSLPPGANLAQLGEVGLRILGLDAAEARRLASTIDWRNTLLVPVPLNAATFRQVTVHGQQGLMIRTTAETRADGTRSRSGNLVMWTEGDRVLALAGDVGAEDVLIIAQSLR